MLPLYYSATIILTIIASFALGKFVFNNYNLSKIFGTIICLFWLYWTLGGSEYFGHDKVWTFSRLYFFQLSEIVFLFTFSKSPFEIKYLVACAPSEQIIAGLNFSNCICK